MIYIKHSESNKLKKTNIYSEVQSRLKTNTIFRECSALSVQYQSKLPKQPLNHQAISIYPLNFKKFQFTHGTSSLFHSAHSVQFRSYICHQRPRVCRKWGSFRHLPTKMTLIPTLKRFSLPSCDHLNQNALNKILSLNQSVNGSHFSL